MEIRAFRGWRYRLGPDRDITSFIAPPYDILSAKDKKDLLARGERNIVAVDMPHVPPKELGPDEVYRAAADLLGQWKAQGVLEQESGPALYAYQQEFPWAGRQFSRRSVLCGVRATEMGKGVIPHEHTFAGPKADRLRLTQYTKTQLSPIFGFYHDEGDKVSQMLEEVMEGKPDAQGMLGQVREKLWVIRDPQRIEAIAAAVRKEPVFIADGHHRYTTALNYRDGLVAGTALPPDHEANFVMFALVARGDPGLLILPTHRIIRNLAEDFTLGKLMTRARDFSWQRHEIRGVIDNADSFLQPFGKGAMAFIGAGAKEAWIATLQNPQAMRQAAPEEIDACRGLDVSILHKLIVDKAMSPWAGKMSIEYTPDATQILEVCRTGQGSLGVCLQGTSLDSVEGIARAGASMPHKSTYFYPKLSTGLVLKPLE